jgi:type I restriction enzyme R subunit
MSVLNESIVEDAAVEWFGDLGYAVGHWPQLAPGELAAERQPKRSGDSRRQSFGEVAPVGRLHEASRRLNPAIPEEARATDKESLSVQNTSKGG